MNPPTAAESCSIAFASDYIRRWISGAEDLYSVHMGAKLTSLKDVAAVFSACCAPRSASDQFVGESARLLFLFLSADEVPSSLLPTNYEGNVLDWSLGPFTFFLHSWYRDFEELQSAHPGMKEKFINSYRDYLLARVAEPDATHAINIDDHWRSRRSTIFFDPFLWHTLIRHRVAVTPDSKVDRIFELAANAVWLANDLGSLSRDNNEESPDLNIIDTYCRVLGLPRADASSLTLNQYNKIIEQLTYAFDSAPELSQLRHFFGSVVDGNLRAMELLPARYTAIEALRTHARPFQHE